MKPSCASTGQPADSPEDGSAGQPAYQSPDSNAQKTDKYCSMWHSKPQAQLAAEYCAVCKQACGYPFGPVRWPRDEVLVSIGASRCYQKRWQFLRLTAGGDDYKNAKNSAVQPVVNQTGIGNTATRMSSPDANSTMAADAVMLQDILIILSQALPPQSLLRLLAGSRTLHHCATCDDVCVVFMHVSLLTDSLPFSAPSSSVVEGRALADVGLDCHGRTVLC